MVNMERAHVWISGRVQGIFFRAHTKEKALALGLKGWVRNLPDGRVEAVFEGKKEKVEEILEFCRKGPPAASVTGVEVEREEPAGEFEGFDVRY
jgi:acylphosphatase